MRLNRIFAVAALALLSTFASADDAQQAIRKTLDTLQLETPIDSIATSPVNGLYEVKMQGGRVLYATGDGKYVMQGNLYQVADGGPVNLTERAQKTGIAKVIAAVPTSEMVVYPAAGPTKTHITVFTDTTCPYCNKLHGEVSELNKMGIEVRYMAFPRQGLGSPGDQQLQAVWCAKDRRVAMDKLVDGKDVDAAKCANPVSKQFALGQSIGVSGTPAVILADGKLIPGYQPAAQMGKLALQASH